MSHQEAAERLGISVSTIRRHVKKGTLPVLELGTKLKRVPLAAIKAQKLLQQ